MYVHGGVVGGNCKDGQHVVGMLPFQARRVGDARQWVEVLENVRAGAEAEAERLHAELTRLLHEARADHEVRVRCDQLR